MTQPWNLQFYSAKIEVMFLNQKIPMQFEARIQLLQFN